jgi:hypothetical protein
LECRARFRSVEVFPSRAKQAAEKGRTNGEDEENHPAAAKAGAHFASFAARLNRALSKQRRTESFSAACLAEEQFQMWQVLGLFKSCSFKGDQ